MFWPIDPESRTTVARFQGWQTVEVLYEFSGPRIFTAAVDGLLQFWYQCAEGDGGEGRFLVVPTNSRWIDRLKTGTKTVHDTLSQQWLWAVDIDPEGGVTDAWVLPGLEEVPVDSKPRPDTPLWPHLTPLLTYRLIGEGLAEGRVPASVVASAVQKPVAALKRLLEFSNNNIGAQGRPEEGFRRLYDLPAQRMAFNSFEVAFGQPEQQGVQDSYATSATHLAEALEWLHGGEHLAPVAIELLEVLKDLAPPAHGQIVRSEVRGLLVKGNRPVVIGRDDRQKVTREIALRTDQQRMRRLEGRIGEFDIDNLALTLREIVGDLGAQELRCTFTDELYDDLWRAFLPPSPRVAVVGRLSPNRRSMEILGVEPAPLPGGGAVLALN